MLFEYQTTSITYALIIVTVINYVENNFRNRIEICGVSLSQFIAINKRNTTKYV